MRRTILRIILVVTTPFLIAMGFGPLNNFEPSFFATDGLSLYYDVPTEEEASLQDEQSSDYYNLFLGKTFVGFKEALGYKESRGNYRVINEFGYMGKYQFGKGTLQMIGIYNSERFLKDTRLQEEAFTAYTARNKWILRKDIERYTGRYINGVKITESGILAAAHLAGAGNVKKYLRSGGSVGFSDAFGTSIRTYLKKFSGYDTSLIEADKQATVL